MSNLKRKASSIGSESDAKKPKANGNIASFFGSSPKPAPGKSDSVASSPAVKFDKEKWVASLPAEQRKLLELEINTLDESWLAHLKDDVTSREFLELKKFLDRETAAGKKWFPPKEDIYSWSRHTKFNNVKVVILGQDPYHNINQAHGMAFSVRPPTPHPPSLRNMFIALKKDYPTFVTPPKNDGLLTPWADRGVLMLNTCLTVRAHEANSHANRGWEKFTQKVIDLVAQKRTRGVVFMAWGTPAGKRVMKVNKQAHLVLQSVHPSPLSASRGYFDCGHYKKANEWLVSRYGKDSEIDWALVKGNSTLAGPVAEASHAASEDAEVKPKAVETKAAQNGVKAAAKQGDDEFGDLEVDSDEEAALQEAMKKADEEEEAKK